MSVGGRSSAPNILYSLSSGGSDKEDEKVPSEVPPTTSDPPPSTIPESARNIFGDEDDISSLVLTFSS